ncbi:hypothetical protein HDV03_004741 [Kappamyces sp. JEL0829]|nr:hypothetical protein HDV03_004741 [Kappamyces sp. JEL0829]
MRSKTGYDSANAKFICPTGIVTTNASAIDPSVGIYTNPVSINGTDYYICTLQDACDLNGLAPYTTPNQWWRFFTAIGLHGGVVHILMNLSFQMQAGFDLEKDIGWWRLAMIYFISGAGGFMFGAGLSDIQTPTVGASGSLYGMIACLFLDLITNWTIIKQPWIELAKMFVSILISLSVGLLPYVDNNAHVGGFIFGFFAGLLFMPKIYYGKWDRRIKQFCMFLSFPVILILGYVFLLNFYASVNFCPGCKYFNCIPGLPWCDQKFSFGTYYNATTWQIQ